MHKMRITLIFFIKLWSFVLYKLQPNFHPGTANYKSMLNLIGYKKQNPKIELKFLKSGDFRFSRQVLCLIKSCQWNM